MLRGMSIFPDDRREACSYVATVGQFTTVGAGLSCHRGRSVIGLSLAIVLQFCVRPAAKCASGFPSELFRLLRNEEQRAREKNPLESIMRIIIGNNDLRVETTTEKLAQKLGRCLRKARGGKG